jgi:putative ABC transport system substrate-binding protein
MIKKIFILFLFLILCHGSAEAEQEILAVQSIRVTPYEEAIKGFESVCNVKLKRLILSDLEGTDVVGKIREIRPDLILAIGMDALLRVKRIKNIPIVYLMVLNPQSMLPGENITGVSMNIPQEKQLTALLKILPGLKNIGLIYDPDRTGQLVKNAQDAAGRSGIKLIANAIHRSKDVSSLIIDMQKKIDLFWMIPDLTVITPETVEFLLLFSLENQIPLLAFSDKYVELGALLSIGIDPVDIGKQAGEMAKKILAGVEVKNVQHVDARKAVISINLKIARKLGMHIDADASLMRKVNIVN